MCLWCKSRGFQAAGIVKHRNPKGSDRKSLISLGLTLNDLAKLAERPVKCRKPTRLAPATVLRHIVLYMLMREVTTTLLIRHTFHNFYIRLVYIIPTR